MNDFLLYILKSTLCISLLYVGFRMLMRKETFFALNRMLLLSVVVCSTIIPLLYLPQIVRPTIQNELIPSIQNLEITQSEQAIQEESIRANTQSPVQEQTIQKQDFPWIKLLQNVYLAGILISLLILMRGIISVLLLFRKAQFRQMNGYQLLILNQEIPPFSFGRFVIISQSDYDAHQQTILAHEQAHIRLNHFYDLALLEATKILHWFNPVIYLLIRDMKEIHEFQADQHTLNKGIDATQYQILIIQKSVGLQRFALANSFNHCQIKNRITMMNKQKTSKAGLWKVATFLPLLALLLMAFSKTGGNVLPNPETSSTVSTIIQEPEKQWTEADFSTTDQLSQWFNSGKLSRSTWYCCSIQIDSKSQLRMENQHNQIHWEELPDKVRKYFDYDFADENTKPNFQKIIVHGKEQMMPHYTFNVLSDKSTSPKDYQKLLNLIGNTIWGIRDKKANEIFNTSYSKLTLNQRDEIDMLVPAIAKYGKSPILASELPPPPPLLTNNKTKTTNKQMAPPPPPLNIEIRKDGYFVNNKMYSLSEILQNLNIWKNDRNTNFTILWIVAPIAEDKILTIKQALQNAKVKHIDERVLYSTETITQNIDKFPSFQGNAGDAKKWIIQNLKYSVSENKIQGTLYIKFVIDSNGNVIDPDIEKGINPELDNEVIHLVKQMPKWEPAEKDGLKINVVYYLPMTFTN